MSSTRSMIAEMAASKQMEDVMAWRLNVALRAGASLEVAELIAKAIEIDLHEWRRLVESGCDPRTAYEIYAPL